MDVNYFLRDLQERHERLVERQRTGSMDATRGRASLGDELDYIQEILAHNLLVMHGLINALVDKGLVTREDVLNAANELDLADGKQDGKIDLESTIPPEKRRNIRRDVFGFLRKLENED